MRRILDCSDRSDPPEIRPGPARIRQRHWRRILSGRHASLWSQPGCGCGCGCSTTICITDACAGSIPLGGVAVAIVSGGTTVSSGTTDMTTGCVTLAIPAAGSYTVQAAMTGYKSISTARSLTCGGTLSLGMTANGMEIITSFSHTCCAPDTLTFTPAGGGGTITLTLTWNSGLDEWLDGTATYRLAPTGVLTISGTPYAVTSKTCSPFQLAYTVGTITP